MMKRASSALLLAVASLALALVSRCASAPPPAFARDRFPLDPREAIAGPFEESVQEGCRELASGHAAQARRDFAGAKSGASRRVASIGTIEALVLEHRACEAIELCAGALADDKPTVPLLTSCGEAQARARQPVEAFALYERAVARAPERFGLAQRAEELRAAATDFALSSAERAAAQGRREEARREVARALAWSPGSSAVLARAADVECDAGERERALEYYREAVGLGGLDAAAELKAADLALSLGDYSMAVSLFDRLAASNPLMRERSEEAHLAFRIDNWPDAERQAARARRVTRAGAALIAGWMFAEVREARVRSGVVAADVLERKDSRAMMRAIALGMLDVDPDTHRARPDASLGRGAAAQMMLRLAAILGGTGWASGCLSGAADPAHSSLDAIHMVTRCRLLSESGGPFVSGAEFTRGLDRLRALLPSGEAANRD